MARSARERLDNLLQQRGLAPTRSKAQALIMAGRVHSCGLRLDKPGARYPVDVPLEVLPGRRFVGRGGHKLLAALERFQLGPDRRWAIDVGASTGGFTQVLLEHGFERVIALDVGRGQLDWTLRNDPRVHVIEGLNARYLEREQLPAAPTLATVDVSFISLTLILAPVARCLSHSGERRDPEAPGQGRSEIVALVKPQFEAGRRAVSRGGIVRDPDVHRQVLEGVVNHAQTQGWQVLDLCPSPIRGADGNREFFMHIAVNSPQATPQPESTDLEALVAACLESGEPPP